MKPATLIIMSIGLVIALIGCCLCVVARNTDKADFPNDDLFNFEKENYEIIDGDTVRTEDFSDKIYVMEDNVQKEVPLDVKVLSVKLKDVDKVEIIGRSDASKVMVYNMQSGFYACKISAGVMNVTNTFEESLVFEYLSDAITGFNGIRRFFNPDFFFGKEKKIIITIDDDDLLNRIDLNLQNCKDVTVKNLTCNLDMKVTLDNSNVNFENCVFKDKEIIYPDKPETPDDNKKPDEIKPTEGDEKPEDGEVKPLEPIVIEHFFSLDLNMRNGSNFDAKACKFSSVNAIVNKMKYVDGALDDGSLKEDPDKKPEEHKETFVSTEEKKCTITLDLTTSSVLYGFNINNVPDEKYISDTTLVTVINGYTQPSLYLENAGNPDFPQIVINASNCEIQIQN